MRLIAVGVLLLAGVVSGRAQGAPDASTALASVGADAVKVVATAYILNANPAAGQAAVKGTWSVGRSRPAACPESTETCVSVSYTLPAGVCEWTVLLLGDGSAGKVLEENEAAAANFLARLTPEEASALAVERPLAVYPAIAIAAKMQGAVVVSVVVSKEGRVVSVVALSGPSMLQGAVMDAVRKWVFTPYKVGERAIGFQTRVTLFFASPGGGFGKVTIQ